MHEIQNVFFWIVVLFYSRFSMGKGKDIRRELVIKSSFLLLSCHLDKLALTMHISPSEVFKTFFDTVKCFCNTI